ncbi:MAG: hypothetical protein IPI67_10005 [Myxococcales bacterium]|nr:hypothetical protein [Myxococcales bacterium]
MRRCFFVALCVLPLGCASVLGIDGEYQDEPAGLGASGGLGGAGGDAAVGGSGGSGLGGGEDCLNGVDDDGNKQIDCADVACQGQFSCEPAAPSGFKGPGLLWTGTGAQPPPPCASGTFAQLGFFAGFSVAPADCSAVGCQCSAQSSPTCLALVKYQTNTCTSSGTYTPLGEGCTDLSVSVPSFANYVTGVSGNLSCSPTPAGSPSVPPIGWTSRHALCVPTSFGAGCAAGVCTPQPDANYSKRCVYSVGTVSCPASYPNQLSVHSSVDDTRGCSACTCDNSGVCAVSAEDFDGTGCSGTSSPIPKGGTCLQITAPPNLRSVKVTASAPACVPGGGTPVGSATPTGPMTVCCQ